MSPVLRYVSDATSALDEARGRGAMVHLVSPVTSKTDALDAIATALAFPAWYGHNLDGLYDCLVDLSWQPDGEHLLIWVGHRRLKAADPEAYHALLTVLADAVAADTGRPLSVLLADT